MGQRASQRFTPGQRLPSQRPHGSRLGRRKRPESGCITVAPAWAHGALDEKVTFGSAFVGLIGTSQPLHMIKIFAILASSSASISLRSATHSREYVGSRANSASRFSIADSVPLFSFCGFDFSGFVRARLIGGRAGSRPKPSQATREG